jgi:hypothetical protein
VAALRQSQRRAVVVFRVVEIIALELSQTTHDIVLAAAQKPSIVSPE